ncbi:alpha/beta-type small acid-soluble spore protein [Metabacillus arenae]|uniref:Alpha/beta-type small acid-soluble spore protein n=1 Tax=Metabacillus arenae TaxID=2771434 RepID=A0A926RVA3_9BACI|nr:alpha/beta-type small acid-soluble spore protein [Metabacillus arenae]MBD1379473.1 alpha/beta-type small acid-soluble spore protein [Metabacillus arenae]
MARKNKLLVPGARNEVDQLKAKVAGTPNPAQAKYEAAKEVGVSMQNSSNGELTSRQAGKIGGQLGGNMVREMVKMAEENLKNKQ